MAGVGSLRCSRGCAGGCECGDKGKCSDSSLLGKRLSEDSSRHQLLQKWASMWSSMSEDASVADTERARLEEAAAAEERPLVFLCSGCRRPLGDSLSWVASQEDTNCILLRCVSCNVSVDKEQKLSKREKENGCILETLCCTGCSLNLGYVYRCTPKNLDYKRDLFCLSVEAIERVLPTIIQEVVFQTLNRIVKSMARAFTKFIIIWGIPLKMMSSKYAHSSEPAATSKAWKPGSSSNGQ
uniref:Protein Mis18-alpha n=1 Tax=Pongo abelii TaxID=9601 RepID=A0A8I5U0K3_PONAB|nr:protein Mis18-alpha isoform X2 [Pongo abelii]